MKPPGMLPSKVCPHPKTSIKVWVPVAATETMADYCPKCSTAWTTAYLRLADWMGAHTVKGTYD